MIKDITGITLTPGNGGKDCKGNGTYTTENGVLLECCCDECDYMACCISENSHFADFVNKEIIDCSQCDECDCPRHCVFT